MSFLRTRLAALAVIAGVLTATSASALAAPAHPVCAAKHHGCGQSAAFASCCCGTADQTTDQNGLVQPRVQAAADLTAVPVLFVRADSAGAVERVRHPRAFPPSAAPPDLVTLFATLLI